MQKFIMLVGLPGSGKSSYISKLTDDVKIHSSDSIRKELFGDESIQKDPSKVFELMKKRTLQDLKNGFDVVYDATNITRKNRRTILSQLPDNVEKICYIVWARVDTCILRDNQRLRTVGSDVINKMLYRFETPWYEEGFDTIEIINTDIQGYELKEFRALLARPHDNPHHYGTIQEHIHRVCDEVIKLDKSDINCNYPLMYELAKYHDVGKAWTKTFVNNKGETTDIAHYYNHQNVGAYITLGLPSTINNPILTSFLVSMHMEPFMNESKFFKNLSKQWKDLIVLFNTLDLKGA